MSNITTSPFQAPRCFVEEGAAYYSMLVVVALFIVCINCGVIFIMVTNSSLRTKRNAFLASLTVSDLLAGLVAVPLNILCNCYNTSLGGLCLAQAICFRFIAISTMLNILMITIERYIGIIYPIRYAVILTRLRVFALLSCTWAISISSALICCSWLITSNPGSAEVSDEVERLERAYFIFVFIAFFFLPLVIMFVLYTRMFLTISKARKSAAKTRMYLKDILAERPGSPAVRNRASETAVESRTRSRSHGSYGDHLAVHGQGQPNPNPRLRSISLLSAPEVPHHNTRSCQASTMTLDQPPVVNRRGAQWNRVAFTRRFSDACGTAAAKLRSLRRRSNEGRFRHPRIVREHRVLIIFVTMLGMFVFCWLCWYMMLFDFVQMIRVPDVVLDCLDIMRFSVSFFNPILYTFLKKDFRVAFANSFGRSRTRPREKSQTQKSMSRS